MHGKIISLKTLYTIHLASRHREVFETNRKLPPCWLGFIVSEGAVQSAGREETSVVLPSAKPHMPQYKPARQASCCESETTIWGNYLLSDWVWDLLHRMGFLPNIEILVKSPWQWRSSALEYCYLLNRHAVKLPPTFYVWTRRPWLLSALVSGQQSVQMQNWSQCWEWETRCSSLTGCQH